MRGYIRHRSEPRGYRPAARNPLTEKAANSPKKPILNTPRATGKPENDICQTSHEDKSLFVFSQAGQTSWESEAKSPPKPPVLVSIRNYHDSKELINREREIEVKMFKVHSCNSLLYLGNAFPPCSFHDVGSISYHVVAFTIKQLASILINSYSSVTG